MASRASVKFMLTAREKAGLLELGYRPDEVEDMRFEVVARVLQRRTRRPFGERPMPREWRRSSSQHGGVTVARPLLGSVMVVLLLVLGGWLSGILPVPRSLESSIYALRERCGWSQRDKLHGRRSRYWAAL
mmetsp:Transcript_63466/g.122146  ORF Transcript_63466/g.122146 Transcript_63466/m.122146 type:complete len:131 (-) Transcript_63466:15-407(-)